MKRTKILLLLLFVSFVLFIIQCAGPKQVASDRPGWVDKGGAFYPGDNCFYGVGAASNITNVSLRRTTAETQARVDLARIFKIEIANLVKIYQQEIVSGGGDASAAEQLAKEATSAFTSMNLSGSQIVDRFYDSVEKTQYSLARLNLVDFQNQVRRVKQLSKEVQESIIENSEIMFDEMEKLKKEQ